MLRKALSTIVCVTSLVIAFVAFPAVGNAAYLLSESNMDEITAGYNLNGIWTATDGATYYIRQVDNKIYWYGERSGIANVAYGDAGDQSLAQPTIYLTFAGLPKNGDAFGAGPLTLFVMNDSHFTVVPGTPVTGPVFGGTFGGTSFTRIQ